MYIKSQTVIINTYFSGQTFMYIKNLDEYTVHVLIFHKMS